jgi:hypothetical protein
MVTLQVAITRMSAAELSDAGRVLGAAFVSSPLERAVRGTIDDRQRRGLVRAYTPTCRLPGQVSPLPFRMYGIYGVALSLLAIAIAATGFRRGERWAWWALLVGNTIGYGAAMVHDQIVRAVGLFELSEYVGPFELSEYLGLATIYGSLASALGCRVGPHRGSTAAVPVHPMSESCLTSRLLRPIDVDGSSHVRSARFTRR